MTVRNVKLKASVRVEYHSSENTKPLENYMERHGWLLDGGATGITSIKPNNSYSEYTKYFPNIVTMENEIEDIYDAFDRMKG